MKLRPIAFAVMTLSSATLAFAATSDKSTAASNPGYSTSLSAPQASMSSQNDNATISQLQQALTDKGFNVGTVDGQLGPKTKSALKKFQQAQGLQPSGHADAQTLAALTLGASTASQSQGASSQGQSTSSPGQTQFSPQEPNASTSPANGSTSPASGSTSPQGASSPNSPTTNGSMSPSQPSSGTTR